MRADPEARALARLLVLRFADYPGDPYYDLYFDRPAASATHLHEALVGLEARLSSSPYLAGEEYSLADIAYVPWIYRVESRLRFDLSPYPAIGEWAERLAERPAVAAERDVVAALFGR